MSTSWTAVLAGLVVACHGSMPAAADAATEGFDLVGREPADDAQPRKGWNYNADREHVTWSSWPRRHRRWPVDPYVERRHGRLVRRLAVLAEATTPVTEDADGNEFVAEFDIKSATGDVPAMVCRSRSRRSRRWGSDELPEVRGQHRTVEWIDVNFVDNQADDGATQRAVQIATTWIGPRAPRQDRARPVHGSAQRRGAGVHRRQPAARSDNGGRVQRLLRAGGPPGHDEQVEGRTVGPDEVEASGRHAGDDLGGLLPVPAREQRGHPADQWTTGRLTR